MDWNHGIHTIERRVNEECPFMRDKIKVYRKAYHWSGAWESQTIGQAFYLYFRGYNANPAQFEIISDEEDPLKGDGITFENTTPIPFSKNLLFEPIPFEML